MGRLAEGDPFAAHSLTGDRVDNFVAAGPKHQEIVDNLARLLVNRGFLPPAEFSDPVDELSDNPSFMHPQAGMRHNLAVIDSTVDGW